MDTNNIEYAYSVFKFQNQANISRLINNGNVYIPNMATFANKDIFSGKIYDVEGSLRLINIYKSIYVTDENRHGLISINPQLEKFRGYIPPYGIKVTQDFRVDNEHIYCCANYFFSDTLAFSVAEDKDACVFIYDLNKFNNIICKYTSYVNILLTGQCIYLGREIIESNPNKNSFTSDYLNNKVHVYDSEGKFREFGSFVSHRTHYLFLLKPKEYYEQYEVRSVWHRNDGKEEPINELC